MVNKGNYKELMNGKKAKLIRKIALNMLVSWTQLETAYTPHKIYGYLEVVEGCYRRKYKDTKKRLKYNHHDFSQLRNEFSSIGQRIWLLQKQYMRDTINLSRT